MLRKKLNDRQVGDKCVCQNSNLRDVFNERPEKIETSALRDSREENVRNLGRSSTHIMMFVEVGDREFCKVLMSSACLNSDSVSGVVKLIE
jgi:hypothetical protein